jgi:hypothetical protein
LFFFKKYSGWVLVADSCNPSYLRGRDWKAGCWWLTLVILAEISGDRDWEDRSSKLVQADSSEETLSSKNCSQKRAGGVAQSVGPEFKPSTLKKTKKGWRFIQLGSYFCFVCLKYQKQPAKECSFGATFLR